MKTFDFVTFNQDDRSANPYEYTTEKEAIKNMHAWAKHCIDDEYIGRRLETVYIDDTEYLDGLEDTERLLKKINQAKESISFETTDGNYLEGTIWEHDTKQFIVHGAQYDNQDGDLRSFVKICATAREAFQFVIDERDTQCCARQPEHRRVAHGALCALASCFERVCVEWDAGCDRGDFARIGMQAVLYQ